MLVKSQCVKRTVFPLTFIVLADFIPWLCLLFWGVIIGIVIKHDESEFVHFLCPWDFATKILIVIYSLDCLFTRIMFNSFVNSQEKGNA